MIVILHSFILSILTVYLASCLPSRGKWTFSSQRNETSETPLKNHVSKTDTTPRSFELDFDYVFPAFELPHGATTNVYYAFPPRQFPHGKVSPLKFIFPHKRRNKPPTFTTRFPVVETTENNRTVFERTNNTKEKGQEGAADKLYVKETTKIVQVGEPIEMLCTAPSKVDLCLILIPGAKDEVRVVDSPNQLIAIPDTAIKIAYNGEGFERGHCGLRIEKATEKLNGIFKCSAFLTGEPAKRTGSMNVTVARTPTNPELRLLDNKINEFKEGDILKATCSVKKGRPATNFTWYLGDEILFDGLKKPVFTTTDDLLSTEQNLTRTIQASDDGKELKCVANHVGLNEQNKQAKKLLRVNFKPKSVQEPFKKFGMVEGEKGIVSIVVEANPKPVFIWTIGGEQVTEGDSQGAYEVTKTMEKESKHMWETTLVISPLTKDDFNKEYRIKASNQYGDAEYEVIISTGPVPETSSIGTGTLILVLLLIALVFLISCVILFARAKGRWCFSVRDDHEDSLPEKGASTGLQDPSQDPMAPRLTDVIGRESSDTESADHSTSVPSKKLSFPMVFKKRNDKLPTCAAGNKIDTCLQRPGSNTNDAEGVVYAELDLAHRMTSSSTVPLTVRPDHDKTEYAEIIHLPKPK
ncbi:fasciclin-3 isoform X2 [Nilaparvata lugens]|uniref:fasciclin-3 isoform X2 n=1 Tax=Nilaparvata lugens TaxID=108931 RepID=UPI00193D3769|nr:fasciclin-3 isoform X2 [Nilaparvata lugens]